MRAKARERALEIERQMQALQSSDPKARREAALYLGEAGAADAVGELIDIYETDEDRRVRKAAAYALGQFKAIDRAMMRGRSAQVEKLLKRVEVEGKLGKRAPNGGIIQIVVLLLVLLALLITAYLFAPQLRAQFGEVAEVAQSLAAPDRDRQTLIADAEAYFNGLRGDSEALFGEYQRLLSSQPLSCAATFANPPTYLISPRDVGENPDIATLVNRLNELREDTLAARAPYDEACAGTRTLTTAESGALLQPLVQTRAAFAELQPLLNTILGVPTATPTLAPNTTPIPSIDLATQVVEINFLIEGMVGETGAATLLLQYWSEAGTTGTTVGCEGEPPVIPGDIALPAEATASTPNLAQAIQQVNTGLAAVRNGWNQLVASCEEGNVSGRARAELINAQAALDSFGLARGLLEQVANGEA
jgi:hypothetical protein